MSFEFKDDERGIDYAGGVSDTLRELDVQLRGFDEGKVKPDEMDANGLQAVQERLLLRQIGEGAGDKQKRTAFKAQLVAEMEALNTRLRGQSKRLRDLDVKDPERVRSLAAQRVVAMLGGS